MRALLTISVVIAAGLHLFPFRTEKLSPPAPMVLGGQPPGRVGRRRLFTKGRASGLSCFLRGAQLFSPVRIELPQSAHALAQRRMRVEERRQALLGEGVEGVKGLGRRVGAELDELGGLLEPDQRVRRLRELDPDWREKLRAA